MNNYIYAGGILAAVMLLAAWRPWRGRRQEQMRSRGRQAFPLRREWLEARFLTLASESGKPRGLVWVDCDFDNRVSFAKDRQSGHLRALVGVTIRFEAEEGGGMEDNPNVGNLRAATAVFEFDGREWNTQGRAIFNLDPDQAIEHFQAELETAE